jgi:RNA polymerase sigma-70 factor (ECF subfamily)
LYARLYLETGDPHRTEDLVQETLLTAFRCVGGLSDPGRFRPWLLKIAQNTAIDAARRDLRRKRNAPSAKGETGLGMANAHRTSPGEALEQEEQRQQVLAVLRSLPEEYRLPLTLRYIGGADYDTICIQLGLTNGSLRGLLHRGLKLLRAALPPELREASD